MRPGCASNLLEAMLEMNPDDEFAATPATRWRRCENPGDFGSNVQATAEAESLFQRVITGFGNVKRSGSTLAPWPT